MSRSTRACDPGSTGSLRSRSGLVTFISSSGLGPKARHAIKPKAIKPHIPPRSAPAISQRELRTYHGAVLLDHPGVFGASRAPLPVSSSWRALGALLAPSVDAPRMGTSEDSAPLTYNSRETPRRRSTSGLFVTVRPLPTIVLRCRGGRQGDAIHTHWKPVCGGAYLYGPFGLRPRTDTSRMASLRCS